MSTIPSSPPPTWIRVKFFMENGTTIVLETENSPTDFAEILNNAPEFVFATHQSLGRLGDKGTIGLRLDKVISFEIVTIEKKVQDK